MGLAPRATIAAAVIAAGCAVAQPEAYPRYHLEVSNSVLVIDGVVRADIGEGLSRGTDIDLHRDLGFDVAPTGFRLGIEVALTATDSLTFRTGLFHAIASHSNSRDLDYDHNTFPAGGDLDSSILLMRYGARYDRTVRSKFILGLGIENVQVRVRIDDLDAGHSEVEDIESSADLGAHLGFRHPLTEEFTLAADLERSLPVGLGDITHNNYRFAVGVERRFGQAGSLTIAFVFEGVDIVDDAEDPPGSNTYEISGQGLVVGWRARF